MSPKMLIKRIMALVLAAAVLSQSTSAFAAEDDNKEKQEPIFAAIDSIFAQSPDPLPEKVLKKIEKAREYWYSVKRT